IAGTSQSSDRSREQPRSAISTAEGLESCGGEAETAGLRVQTRLQLVHQAVDGHPDLVGAVALPDGDGHIVEGVEVDRDAVGRADLVLAAVPASDRLRLVVVAHEVRLAQGEHLAGHWGQRLLLGKGEHRYRIRRYPVVEAQHRTVLAADLVLVVG